MQLVERNLSYKAKLDKMYRGQFYLTRTLNKEFIQQLEEGSIIQDKNAVEFIDNHGEWMARYRVYSQQRVDGPRYLSGPRTEHRWARRDVADTYTALQAIKKCAHVNHMVRGNNGMGTNPFTVERVEDDTANESNSVPVAPVIQAGTAVPRGPLN